MIGTPKLLGILLLTCISFLPPLVANAQPIMSGFEFVGKARIINPKVKILLMTAFDIDNQEFAGVTSKLKIDGYIQKPISMGKLNGIIDMHMMPK
jgi:two-component SAPR family response regulator